jgi:hypothetical protein
MTTPNNLSKFEAEQYQQEHLSKLGEMVIEYGEDLISEIDDDNVYRFTKYFTNNLFKTRTFFAHLAEYLYTRGYAIGEERFRTLKNTQFQTKVVFCLCKTHS